MSRHSPRGNGVDYSQFESSYTGLVTMIFLQAHADLMQLHGRKSFCAEGIVVSEERILKFFRSRWASCLGSAIGIEDSELKEYAERYENGKD